jgi:ribonuclease-3
MNKLEQFQKKIKVNFKNNSLLQEALTHRSYLNEHPSSGREHNERLEFLGDAVLELIITKLLYKKFPQKPEGELTSLRASLVNTKSLARVAGQLKINQYLYLSKGESRLHNQQNHAILANTFEAIIGALYLDQGLKEAQKFIEKHLWTQLEMILKLELYLDPKSHLQELTQEKYGYTPSYQILKEKGPDHSKKFESGVFFEKKLISVGQGSSKQAAEVNAAKKALQKIKKEKKFN